MIVKYNRLRNPQLIWVNGYDTNPDPNTNPTCTPRFQTFPYLKEITVKKYKSTRVPRLFPPITNLPPPRQFWISFHYKSSCALFRSTWSIFVLFRTKRVSLLWCILDRTSLVPRELHVPRLGSCLVCPIQSGFYLFLSQNTYCNCPEHIIPDWSWTRHVLSWCFFSCRRYLQAFKMPGCVLRMV